MFETCFTGLDDADGQAEKRAGSGCQFVKYTRRGFFSFSFHTRVHITHTYYYFLRFLYTN